MKRLLRQFCLVTALILSWLPLTALINSPKAAAVSASDWNPARIIDDSVFFNWQSMSTQDIQNFLNAKMPVCSTNHTKSSNPDDSGPPYTCLKDFTQDVPTMGPDTYCPGSVSAGRKSAAAIIKEVSVACNINPQVMLVLLQKEQSLITDDWPWQEQYDKATGYGCPDTSLPATVDSNHNGCYDIYEGFSKQVYYGARGYQRYVKDPDSYNYAVGRTSYVAYQANNTSCGGTNITMQTQATAALYNYTPYQPNQAALNDMYGSGDIADPAPPNCSAFGNRNFWRMFNDWFGSTMSNIPYTNLKWSFENLDGSQIGKNPRSDIVGFQPHSAVFDGKLFVFSHNLTTRRLEMTVTGPGDWAFSTLDGAGGTSGRINANVGTGLSSVVFGNMLHVFYHDATNGDLRHAWLSAGSSTWTFETLDSNNVVGTSSTAVDDNGKLRVFYYDSTLANLRHGWFIPGEGWRFENLEGDYGSISGYNSDIGRDPAAIAYAGGVQLFYHDQLRGNLRHAWTTATGWKFENLDGDFGSIARKEAVTGIEPSAVNANGHIQLFYYDASNTNLRHAWTSASGWKFENLEGDPGSISRIDGNIGRQSTTLIHDSLMYVFYRNDTNGSVRKAWADQGGWHFVPLEGTPNSVNFQLSNTGFDPSAVSYGSSLQLFYFDNDQRALRHAWGVNRW